MAENLLKHFTVGGHTRRTEHVDIHRTGMLIAILVLFSGACSEVGQILGVAREIPQFALKGHLSAGGILEVERGRVQLCPHEGVRVDIERKVDGEWRKIKSTTTNENGFFDQPIPDQPGAYRAVAPESQAPRSQDTCVRAVSPVQRHRH